MMPPCVHNSRIFPSDKIIKYAFGKVFEFWMFGVAFKQFVRREILTLFRNYAAPPKHIPKSRLVEENRGNPPQIPIKYQIDTR
jgi:hypothetical protein